jgi:hypothetical protein
MKQIVSPKAVHKPKNTMARKMMEDSRLVAGYILGEESIENIKAKAIKYIVLKIN